jgi:hypothetical protein
LQAVPLRDMLSVLPRRLVTLALLLTPFALILAPAGAAARSIAQSGAADVTLTVTMAGSGSGRVTSSPAGVDCGSTCSYNFPVGTQVTLTATSTLGSSFAGWYSTPVPPATPPCMGGTPTCTFTLNQSESIRATFDVVQESVSVLNAPQPGSSGTITISGPGAEVTVPPGQQKQAFFNYGASVSITPSPASGSAFIGWSGDCSGFGACVFVATNSILAEGSFAVAETLKVQVTGKGSGTVTASPGGLGCPSVCTGVVGVGAPVTLTATPAPGSYFADWSLSGGCGSSSSPCTFEMPASDDLEVAVFRLDHCLVPNVRRLPLARARSQLDAYSCRAGTVKRAFSARVRKGTVISQRPTAGARLARGAKVRLVLSLGRRQG